jgi:SAM-dependent methyltransferase
MKPGHEVIHIHCNAQNFVFVFVTLPTTGVCESLTSRLCPRSDGDSRLPYPDGHFCAVTALMVLHHVPDADASVREIVRVLRPGGMLVLREHDCASPTLAAVIDTLHGFYAAVWYARIPVIAQLFTRPCSSSILMWAPFEQVLWLRYSNRGT